MPVIDYNSVAPREIAPGFVARFVHSDRITMARVEVKQGAALATHTHPHEQVTTVLAGELELTVAGETRVLRPGVVALIPGSVPHSARAITECVVMDVWHPVREEYR
jgi:quercetin dioxygenase-like cupin family protein